MLEVNEISLEKMPTLKRLLTEYCYYVYEEAAEPIPAYLVAEYYLLEREKRLHELFMVELLKAPPPYSEMLG